MSKVSFMPTPFDGEHFAGVVSRKATLLDSSNPKLVFERMLSEDGSLSNQRIYHPLIDIAANAYEGSISREYLLKKHSLFPYYSPSMHFRDVDKIINKRIRKGGLWKRCEFIEQVPSLSAPLCRILSFSLAWRWCPLCAIEDEKRVGTSYWHVEHQLPSMITCSKHACELCESCNNCGFSSIDIRIMATPPTTNKCTKCGAIHRASYVDLNGHITWVQQASMDLLNSPGMLSKPYFEHVMKRGIQSGFSNLNGGRIREQVFVAARLQQDFVAWFFEHGFERFFHEPEVVINYKTLSLEKALRNVNGWHPLFVLMWLRFLAVEWPSLEIAA